MPLDEDYDAGANERRKTANVSVNTSTCRLTNTSSACFLNVEVVSNFAKDVLQSGSW